MHMFSASCLKERLLTRRTLVLIIIFSNSYLWGGLAVDRWTRSPQSFDQIKISCGIVKKIATGRSIGGLIFHVLHDGEITKFEINKRHLLKNKNFEKKIINYKDLSNFKLPEIGGRICIHSIDRFSMGMTYPFILQIIFNEMTLLNESERKKYYLNEKYNHYSYDAFMILAFLLAIVFPLFQKRKDVSKDE